VRLGRGTVAAAVAVAPFVLVPVAAVAQEAPAPTAASCSLSNVTVTAAQVVACLAVSGLDGTNVVVADRLDLTPLGTVEHPVRCQHCRLQGGLRITDVTFTRAVDFNDVLIDGDVDARGATFQGPVLARGDRSATSGITGTADFSLATFADAATFDELNFSKSVSFDGATFGSSVSLEGSDFGGDLGFERAEVTGFLVLSGPAPADLNVGSGAVKGSTTMADGVFRSTVDLHDRKFTGGFEANGGTFLGRADLSNATFGTPGAGRASFDGASFSELDAQGATFFGSVSIRLVRAASINLGQATAFSDLSLEGTQVAGAASFDASNLQGDLDLEKFTAARIVLDIGALTHVASESSARTILSTIEKTAREAGDIPLANSARFRLLQIDGARSAFPRRQLDWAFYEETAGYLVRPLRPLRTLALLILLGTAARYVVDARRARQGVVVAAGAHVAAMNNRVRVGHELTGFLQRFSRAVIASLRPKPNIASPVAETTVEPYVIAGLRLVEYLASKLLIVVFFLSLGNYNATLRDVLGSVKL
jgi:uncharacterized protein YjbI with pentapeptide repeats